MDKSEYRDHFQNLNVNRRGDKVAPHKAILLLSVIEMIEDGMITTPFVALSDALVRVFNDNWDRYVSPTSGFSRKLNYPFFHLSSSPFWKLEKSPLYEEKKEYSMSALKRSFTGAYISQDLFDLLCQEDFRNEIKTILTATYISNNKAHINRQSLSFGAMLSIINILLIA